MTEFVSKTFQSNSLVNLSQFVSVHLQTLVQMIFQH